MVESTNNIPKYIGYPMHILWNMAHIDLSEIVCIEDTSITVRGYRRRTTIPSGIFKFLNLKHGDTIRWVATKDGRVFIIRLESSEKPRKE